MAAILAAAVVGVWLGRLSHATPEEIRLQAEANALPNAMVSREVNRVLLELWKMEEGESARGLRLRP